ncbi:MAG: hypothetical protein HY854_03465 [Burkholderiales bacterium]|nr:hypothetical protein [Burkholderiales bacterium]
MSTRSLTGLLCALALAAQAETAPVRRGYLGLQLTPSGTALTCGRPIHACEGAWASAPQPGSVRTAYGARLRWHFSPTTSASFGVDAYEPLAGNRERVREASFELQWRY